MSPRSLATGRGHVSLCMVALLLAAGLSACGRRGALEAPPDASAAAARSSGKGARPAAARPVTQADATSSEPNADASRPNSITTQPQSVTLDTADDEGTVDPDTAISPLPTPAAPNTRKRGRNFTIPKEPFILDPIL